MLNELDSLLDSASQKCFRNAMNKSIIRFMFDANQSKQMAFFQLGNRKISIEISNILSKRDVFVEGK